MNSLMDIFYFFFIFMIGVSLLLSVLGLWFTAIMPGMNILMHTYVRLQLNSVVAKQQ